MNPNLLFDFKVNREKNTIEVMREFAADLNLVWSAWTDPDMLDQWWAPKPYRTETKSMYFNEGGTWLYAIISPEGEKKWCMADYIKIEYMKKFVALDGFCDDEGNLKADLPRSLWSNTFVEKDNKTTVSIHIKYDSLEDLEKIIAVGFKEGLTMAIGNLDQYIEAKVKLRNEKKTPNNSRVSTYLNFPGNTEEAFVFYKSVFKSEYTDSGIQRFGDLPPAADHPPISDAVKNMILLVELPITANHILMGTDAPKELGFNLIQGNNMHIQIEPDSKADAQRIFDELSSGGSISLPLQDMFWGAYVGSFTDKYGINWMINYLEKK